MQKEKKIIHKLRPGKYVMDTWRILGSSHTLESIEHHINLLTHLDISIKLGRRELSLIVRLGCFLVLTPHRLGQQTPSYKINEHETLSLISGLSLITAVGYFFINTISVEVIGENDSRNGLRRLEVLSYS
jgi:hypothetical protein